MIKKKRKEYTVSFDMKYSHDFTVTAISATDAKRKAFNKLKPTINKLSQYNIYVDKK